MDFQLNDELTMLRKSVRDAEKKVKPRAAEIDEKEGFCHRKITFYSDDFRGYSFA